MRVIIEKAKAPFHHSLSLFLPLSLKVCVPLYHLKNTLLHADSNAFIEYVEYYFPYVYTCINDILWYSSFYNLSFSLSIFLRSISVDIWSLVTSIKALYCILGNQCATFYWPFSSWWIFRLFLIFFLVVNSASANIPYVRQTTFKL